MSKRESISRYLLIIKILRKHPAPFCEIAERLRSESEMQGYDFNVTKRTFQRDLDDIRSLYEIDIQYDYSRKVYYIEIDQQPEVSERMLEAFDIFNALHMSDRLSDSIHFEKRRSQGTENLYGLLHASKHQLQIKFTYRKYWEDSPEERQVEPYALKEFKNRWYLLSKDLKDNRIKSFALDRLTNLEITKKKFQQQNDFNVNAYYKHCFGIINPNTEKPQEVILSFNPIQGKYIKSLPLHGSQQVLLDNNKELIIKLNLYITFDFIMELLSYGDHVKIVKPDSLIKEIKTRYQNALKHYK